MVKSSRIGSGLYSRRWWLLLVVSAGLFLVTLDNTILYTALPTLTRDLHATGLQSLWFINAYPLVMSGLLLGSGTLGDRVGHRHMFMIGVSVFCVASLVASFAPDPGVFIVSRVLLAVGASTMMPSTLALIRATFTVDRELNMAVAIWGSISVISMTLGPVIAGVLLRSFWWGSVFLINVPFALMALLAIRFVAPADRPDRSKRWDALSSGQAMAGLMGTVVAVKELAHVHPSWIVVAAGLACGVLGFVFFVRRQRRLERPLVDFHVFRIPTFSCGVLSAMVSMFTLAGIQFVTTQRYQFLEGFTPLQSGFLVTAVALGTLPSTLAGGALLSRVGFRPIISGGFALTTLGAAVALVGSQTLFVMFVVGLIILGLGLGFVMSVASTAIVSSVAADRAGMASSIEEVSYELGSLMAVTILGSLITFVYSVVFRMPAGGSSPARQSLPDALASGDSHVIAAAGEAYDIGFRVVLEVIVAVLALSAVATYRLLRKHRVSGETEEKR
ncbi:MAG: MFS transporter [Bifidobacterium sp.]|jgi:DHA2 family multidrug resistance protein-like MFS transporter